MLDFDGLSGFFSFFGFFGLYGFFGPSEISFAFHGAGRAHGA